MSKKRAPVLIPDDPKAMEIYIEWQSKREQERLEQERVEQKRLEQGRVKQKGVEPLLEADEKLHETFIEWESRGDSKSKRDKVAESVLEDVHRRNITSRAELMQFPLWTQKDLCLYFQKERKWVRKNVVPRMKQSVPYKDSTYWHRDDVLATAKRIPTDTAKVIASHAKTKTKKKKKK
jgi:hypothetical protein